MAGTDIGNWNYKEKIHAAFIKLHNPKPHIRKSGCRLNNCCATASAILRYLH